MFAESSLLSPAMSIAIGSVLAGLFLFSTLVFVINRYKRCPSNRILVIYGKVRGGTTSKCIHGGAAFIWPVIQDYAFLHLEPIQIGVPLKDALSAENIRVEVPSVFTVAIGTQPEIMQNAAIRLLGLNTAQIKQQAEDIIFGQMRQVIASMRIEDINRDREKFLQQIQHSLEPELKKIGLVLINVNITDIKDESGYIKALGQKAASQALQQARGDVAEQEKEGEIRVAEAERAMAVQVANAAKLREIGMKEAKQEEIVRVSQLNQEQAVRLAEFNRDQEIGEQTASFQKEIQINEADRAKRIAVAEANAKAIAGESKSQADIAAAQADLHVKKADAYQLAETRKREAEAAVLEAQNRAMAKAALAEAERVEAEQRAALEAPAKADKAKTIVEAEAEAEKRKISAMAEAAAIYAKLEAEARGQYEILAKKGEGLERIISACGGSQQAFQLLMLEHLDVLAQTSAQAISNIKFDKVVVWEQGGNSGQSSTASFLNGLSRSLPPMVQVLKDVAGIEVPEYFAKLTPDDKPQDSAGPLQA
jgi:flotillin